MVEIGFGRLALAVVRNQARRLGIIQGIRRLYGKAGQRGGTDWTGRALDRVAQHILAIHRLFLPRFGDVHGKTGIEIGPGDNLGVAYCLCREGARRIYTVEKYAEALQSADHDGLFSVLDTLVPGADVTKDQIQPFFGDFEDLTLPEPVDFVYSHDVLEHVSDIEEIFRHVWRLLKPGGVFVSSVDMSGHNVFSSRERPLEFLTCPPWLWRLMLSHCVTTNKVRCTDLRRAAGITGFVMREFAHLRTVDADYVESIRPRLQPPFRSMSNEDLCPIQVLFIAEKPPASPVGVTQPHPLFS